MNQHAYQSELKRKRYQRKTVAIVSERIAAKIIKKINEKSTSPYLTMTRHFIHKKKTSTNPKGIAEMTLYQYIKGCRLWFFDGGYPHSSNKILIHFKVNQWLISYKLIHKHKKCKIIRDWVRELSFVKR